MSRTTPPQALTIASSDSGGGAGIQADIKALQANGVYALSAIVAVTAQNTQTVAMVHELPREIIEAQIDAVYDDFEIGAVKTGMLFSAGIVEWVSDKINLRKVKNLVVDPVMISKDGTVLLKPNAVDKMKQKLFPLAAVVTPNIPEAEKLAGMEIDSIQKAEDAARRIHDLGPRNVLITGGHLESGRGTDLLYDGSAIRTFSGEWIETKNTHGTGCTYSAAITAGLAKGWDLEKSIKEAKRYMTGGLRNSLSIGGGHGPMDHFYFLGEN